MADAAPALVAHLLRAAAGLSAERAEIFDRLYLHGQSAQKVQQDLGMDGRRFESERRSMLRALICATSKS